ncbi:TIGR02099 family protein [Ramlibacter sp. G-1-2-2]|uniref:TIGR02099 family protein n=1 Tax=Ramlibacter agri TaxID=2728837 RepID=A0A848H1X9_9BURK|nr:YhdP family protein [Ramlibacter agri]NML42733.1 TIGR02099 family protein [Ramlibacter agri]
MNATPTRPSRSLKLFAAAVKWSLWLLLAASLLLAAAWGALHAWIVPRIGEFRPALELRASQVLGVPVRIGGMSARSEGLIPSFELQDVVLLDPKGREALRLPLVVGALSPRSVWNLGFEQLYIHAPRLDIRRTADGHFFVGGLDFARSSDNAGRAADWFFRQGEFVIQGGTISWTDEMRRAPTLALQEVDFVVRNQGRGHAIRLDATPPAGWGSRFTLAAQFRQPLLSAHPGQWQQWSGEMHADFSAVDLSQLRHHADLGVDITQGHGRVRAWADVVRGQLVGGTADVVLADVNARLAPDLEPLALQSVSGRVGGKRLAQGFQLETHDLEFVTQDGLRWPGGNFALNWTPAQGQQAERGELKADRLDLGALSQVASRLPLGTPTHAALQAYKPQGLVDTLQARWQGPVGALQSYEVRGRASRLEVAAQADHAGHTGIPGVRGASMDFELTQAGGHAKLNIARGALDFPGVFEQAVIPVDRLAGELQWQVNGPSINLSVNNLKFANADAEGEAQASWRTGDTAKGQPRFPGTLDLQGNLGRADGARVWRYLPLGVPKEARDYVQDSVASGLATSTKFKVKGDLRKFPWPDNRDGEFLISAQVKDVQFAYVPRRLQQGPVAWPALTQLAGELVFQGDGMAVKGASGRLAGTQRLAFKANAQIPDFRQTRVDVHGDIRGPLSEALGVVNNSPINGFVNQALAHSTGNGDAVVGLHLDLPVDQIARSQVQGTVTLAGNDIQLSPDSPALARTRGTVLFSDKGFQVVGATARALGGDLKLEGGSRNGNNGEAMVVQLRAQGTATAEGLRQARELGFVARLAQGMQGSAGYQLTLGFRRGQPEVLVTSNLQGMALDLPAPLGKTAEAVLPLKYETALTRESLAAPPGQKLQELLTLELGRLGGVSYLRELGPGDPQVLRGAIALGLGPGETVVLPDQGVTANVQLGNFDVGAWQRALTRVFGAETTTPNAVAATDGASSSSSGYLPTVAALRARQLVVQGRTLHNLVAGASRDGSAWRGNVTADELNGYVEWRPGQNGGRVMARLARLNIAASQASQVESLLDKQPDSSIPALDVVVDEFELKGRKLGRLEIDAANRGPRDWRLNKLALNTPDAQFTASGAWAAMRPADPRRTVMKFKLDIADAGELLNRFGMPGVIRGGRGTMDGNVSWAGSPLALEIPTLTGGFNINVENGQFLKADPGLAKLLGVLSLQTLPRRLTLDFRDVFSAGFQFDFVRGDLTIDQGIAATNNLQMKGVNAAVLMEGKADIARETQDLKVLVIPEINAGTASLVAGVINPAIGLGTFLAQMFLRQPLMRAATQEFHIDGTWTDPRVTRVGRQPASPAQADANTSPTAR